MSNYFFKKTGIRSWMALNAKLRHLNFTLNSPGAIERFRSRKSNSKLHLKKLQARLVAVRKKLQKEKPVRRLLQRNLRRKRQNLLFSPNASLQQNCEFLNYQKQQRVHFSGALKLAPSSKEVFWTQCKNHTSAGNHRIPLAISQDH